MGRPGGVLGLPDPLEVLRELRSIARAVGEIPRMAAALEDLLGDLGGMRQDLSALRSGFEELRVNVDPMDEDLEAVELAVRGLVPVIHEVRDAIDALRSDLDRIPFMRKSSL
ncbi:MAG: hypothetical protein M3459_04365 [Actinomycetota bacterium]|nr:hypothetical protein [Actinomycetota bacterium]